MDALTRLMLRARKWLESDSRRRRITRRSRFLLEPLESRVLLSSTPIAVTQFAAAESGFTAQLNQAVDATVLNLYDTEAGTLGPADVTVVGATQGAVNGNKLTFIKTGGILAPDTYTVTMRSATNGIKGADGSFLDGDSDGDAGNGPFFGGSGSSPIFNGGSSPVFNAGSSPAFDPGASSPVFNPEATSPIFNPKGPLPLFNESLSFKTSNTSNVDLTFILDTSSSGITALRLSAGSDTGAAGDDITDSAQVLLTGASDSGAALTLSAATVLAGAGGVFQKPNVDLSNGDNAFTLMASHSADNTAPPNLTVTGQGTHTADVALQWNQQALEPIRLTVTDPSPAARALTMVSLAQYETPAAIDGTPAYLIHESVAGPVSVDAALAEAAYTVRYALFPSQRSVFDTTLNELLATISNSPAKTNALSLGISIGSAPLSIRSNDGPDAFVDHTGSPDSGIWRSTDPMFDLASELKWGEVIPFALTSGDEFRPDAPPVATPLIVMSIASGDDALRQVRHSVRKYSFRNRPLKQI
jgi:hypothetical protein